MKSATCSCLQRILWLRLKQTFLWWLKFNLAVRLRQAYGKGLRPDTSLEKLARAGLAKLRASQVQVPELSMPGMVLGRGSLYSIYGDMFY